ncbi:MAG: hypothetical protein AAFR96_08265 [Planctomycetota bacterium]
MDKPPPFTDAGRFAAFIWLFAAFSIVHEILDARRWATHGFDVIAASIGAMLAAGLVLASPRSAWRLGVMAAALLYVKIDDMPFTPNHVLFTSLICLGLLVLAIAKGRTSAWLDVGSRTLGPAVRVALCIVYGYAVLHKLNTDYFDPEFSCGPVLFRDLRGYLPLLPSGAWIDWPAIVGSLLTEGGLGVLLLFRRTRTAAIAVGLAFHALLAFHPNVYIMSFSTLIIPLYALFLPLPMYGRLARLASRLPTFIASPGVALRYAPLGVVVLLIAFGVFHVVRDAAPDPGTRYELLTNALGPIPRGVSLAFVFAASGVFFLAVAMTPRAIFDCDDAEKHRAKPVWPMAALNAVVVFNGLCPYLGLKTQTSFSMFSNLRTEAKQTNHFFMPSLGLTGRTLDLVSIDAISGTRLRRYEGTGELIPFFELQRVAARDTSPGFSILFTPLGEAEPVLAERGDPDGSPRARAVFDTPPLLLRKVLGFRAVPPLEEGCGCRH